MDEPGRELGSVRYLVDDVGAAVDFYGGVLGFRVGFDRRPAIAELRAGVVAPAGQRRRPARRGGRCPTAGCRRRAAGTASTCWSTTSTPRWPG